MFAELETEDQLLDTANGSVIDVFVAGRGGHDRIVEHPGHRHLGHRHLSVGGDAFDGVDGPRVAVKDTGRPYMSTSVVVV